MKSKLAKITENEKITFQKPWTTQTIKNPIFQRLKKIKQTSVTSPLISHPHTRFAHSIGTSNLITELLKNPNFSKKKILPKIQEKAIFAGLCHDIGHGPFSHDLEYTILPQLGVYNWSHEKMTVNLIEKIYEDFENVIFDIKNIDDVIESGNKNMKNEVFGLISNKKFGIDCDRVDYLIRDSFYSQVELNVDFGKIKEGIFLTDDFIGRAEKDFYLGFDVFMIEEFYNMLDERFWMYENIYCNPNSIGFNLLRSDIIFETALETDFVKRVENIDSFVFLDDGILDEIKNLKNKSPKVQSLLKRYDSGDCYDFCLEFEVCEKILENFGKEELFEFSEKLKRSIFDRKSNLFDLEEDLVIFNHFLNKAKDVDFDDIMVRSEGQHILLSDFEHQTDFENLKKIRFQIYTKKKDVKEDIVGLFKNFYKNNESMFEYVCFDTIEKIKIEVLKKRENFIFNN